MIFGSHFFSRLSAGTHLASHCGPSNLRLRVHLGLIVPEGTHILALSLPRPWCSRLVIVTRVLLVPTGTRIRCGLEERAWREGECLIFDDSFEHEVWHDGDTDRIVLIADMFHPDVDLESMVMPLLSQGQRLDLESAMADQHQPVLTRHYSTGEFTSIH